MSAYLRNFFEEKERNEKIIKEHVDKILNCLLSESEVKEIMQNMQNKELYEKLCKDVGLDILIWTERFRREREGYNDPIKRTKLIKEKLKEYLLFQIASFPFSEQDERVIFKGEDLKEHDILVCGYKSFA